MDPVQALFEIQENAPVFWNPSTPKDTRLSLAEHIIEHAEALAEWLVKQGYVPKERNE
jgi:hypothetical protein